MINVNQITSRLASMPDQALQQYAAMHKNDPYTMALALAESNRRKQMRQGAQMQAPQQPKVVDQEIAGMAQAMPEDTGIGQLPAPNMQRMAEGGIVAFEDGGAVPGYAEGVYTGRPTGGLLGDIPGYVPGATSFGLPQPGVEDPNSLTTLEKLKRWNERGIAERKLKEVNAARAQAGLPPVAQTGTPLVPTTAPYDPATATRRSAFLEKAPPAPSAPPVVAATKPPALAVPTPPAQPAGISALNTKPMSAEDAVKEAAKLGDDKEVRKELQDYVNRQKQLGEETVGSFEKGIAGLPEAYKQYESRLQKEEAEAATDKDKALGMSIFKAGLAMMSGTSQNAFENIGKGAMVGLEDQQAALKDFKKAQRERDKAFGDIEAARLADQRGDLKTKLELESRAADRNANAEGKMVDGIAKLFETNKTNARGIYQTGIEQTNQNQRAIFEQGEATNRTLIQERGATARTNAQLSAPPAEARMAMMLGTGKTQAERLESGLKKIQDLQSDKTGAGYAKMYAEHVAESRKNMTEPMTPTEFAASMRGILTAMSPKVVTAPGANSPVYNRP
jgi:hypothetical protein